MSHHPNRAAGVAIAFLLTLTVVILLAFGHHGHRKSVIATVSSGASTSHSSSARTSPSTTPSIGALQTAASTATQLSDRVSGFIKAFYHITPTSTSLSLSADLASYVLPGSNADIDTELSSGTVANQALLAGINLEGEATVDDLIGEPVNGNPQELRVTVPVILIETSSMSSPVSYAITTVSDWQYQAGQWFILDFHEGGETG